MTSPAATVIELTLPFFPEELDRNHGSDNRYVRAKAVKAYKRSCWVDARNLIMRLGLKAPLATPVRAEITFVVKNSHRDADNCLASFKAGLDALVSAGLLKDDNSKVLSIVPVVVSGAKNEIRVRLEAGA